EYSVAITHLCPSRVGNCQSQNDEGEQCSRWNHAPHLPRKMSRLLDGRFSTVCSRRRGLSSLSGSIPCLTRCPYGGAMSQFDLFVAAIRQPADSPQLGYSKRRDAAPRSSELSRRLRG